jgi:hypothetical protein
VQGILDRQLGAEVGRSDLMRLLASSGDLCPWLGCGDDGLDVVVELAGEVALEASGWRRVWSSAGSSEAYGMPIALAILKLPTGAVTAVLGLVLMRGGFVPGLSALDTSAQILAWAAIFGYAQQLFTRLVDQQAKTVLDNVRGGDNAIAARPST